jgi:hypothetical protein
MEASLSVTVYSVYDCKINKGIREEIRMYKINIISGDCKRWWTEQLLRKKDTRISISTGQKKCKTKERRPKQIK